MLVDCKSFYYTYNLLEPYNPIPKLTDDVEEIEHYFEEQEKCTMLVFPCIVNGALAAELALKFLTFHETKSFKKTHNLKELYNKLPPVHKAELLVRLKTQANQNEKTLIQNLETFDEAFVCFRYPSEKDSVGISGIFHNFVKIVCEYAFELDKPYDCEVEE